MFIITAYPTLTPSGTATQNATGPVIVINAGSGTSTAVTAMVGTLVAMMTVILGMAISRYVPKNVILQIKHIIPQSFIDNFKRDPLGTIKNIKMPTNIDELRDMIPEKLFNQTPALDNATSNVTAPDHIDHVQIEPGPAPAPEPTHVTEPAILPIPDQPSTPIPQIEPLSVHVPEPPVSLPLVEPRIIQQESVLPVVPVSPPPGIGMRVLHEDTGVSIPHHEPLYIHVPYPQPLPPLETIVPGQVVDEEVLPKPEPIQINMNQFISAIKAPSRTSSSILQINTEDLAAVRAFLDAKGTDHKVIS